MIEALRLADARVLLWLNHALAAHPSLYWIGLKLTDEVADLCFFTTCLALWFWRERRVARTDGRPPMARVESRARLLVFGLGGVAAYVATRLLALSLDHPRPFATYLPVRGVEGAFEGLRTFGTFPSDHAALLGALPIGFAQWSNTLARVWLALGLFLMVVRIAVGFHYPVDMLAGAVVGIVAATAAVALYENANWLRSWAGTIALGFEKPPWMYGLYGLLALGAVEFAFHFKHVLFVILVLKQRLGY